MKDSLIQVNSTSPGKPHLHTLATGLIFPKKTQGSALHRAQSCLPPGAGWSANSQVQPSSHHQDIALWCWEGTKEEWKRGKKKFKCHARDALQMEFKPKSPKAKQEFSWRRWHAARLPGFRAAEKSPIALFGGVQCLVAPSSLHGVWRKSLWSF